MTTIKVKGHEIEAFIIKDSFTRRAVQFRNDIIHSLKQLKIPENQVDIELEKIASRKSVASAIWYFEGRRLYFSNESCSNFAENLYIVSQVIAREVDAVLEGRKEVQDFIGEFSEEEDVLKQRKEARETLGLDADVKDIEVINKRYKDLAREHHPDVSGGNLDKFKAINHAHKVLKRELA